MQLENFEDIGKCKLFFEITNSWNFVLDHLVSENEISENILKKVRKYLLQSSFTCVVAKQLFKKTHCWIFMRKVTILSWAISSWFWGLQFRTTLAIHGKWK